jgi:hypothetical protein
MGRPIYIRQRREAFAPYICYDRQKSHASPGPAHARLARERWGVLNLPKGRPELDIVDQRHRMLRPSLRMPTREYDVNRLGDRLCART